MEQTENRKTSLKTQGAWLLFAKFTGFVLAFLLPLLVVRYLSQEKVGVYRQAFLFIMNAVSILPLGFSMSSFYFLSRENERRNSVILNILLFNFATGALACGVLFAFPQLLGRIFQNEELTRLAPLIGITIWLWIFSAFLEIVAVANREAKLSTVFIILAQLTKTSLMAGAVILFSTVEAFLYAAIFQGVLQTAILLIYLAKKFPRFWLSFDSKFFREQAVYALPLGLAGVIYTLQTDLHNYFVSHRFGSAEFAVYAYGCFQLPLLVMLGESVTSVLIPRMSELQKRGDTQEIIRLTARAMQKLAFFYFPVYAFFLITAETFITTLFTEKFAASVPVFLINITILPFDIWITDPIVRAYKELGRFLLALRVFVLVALVGALYFGSQNFGLRGMIGIVVVITILERAVTVFAVARKLGVEKKDFWLLNGVWKTAAAAITAGIALFAFYFFGREILLPLANETAAQILSVLKMEKFASFAGGSLFLGVCFIVFAVVYLPTAGFLGLIEDSEKEKLKSLRRRFFGRENESEPLPNEQ